MFNAGHTVRNKTQTLLNLLAILNEKNKQMGRYCRVVEFGNMGVKYALEAHIKASNIVGRTKEGGRTQFQMSPEG